MKTKKALLLLLTLLIAAPVVHADKGMYLIAALRQENMDRMKELGLKLDADDLYNPNGDALSDAVVIFGNGCTGITVSQEGLIFTNHHCGYGSIQKLSSVEHDYLRDGFVSHQKSEELPVPGLSVRYLREFVDVTAQVLASVADMHDADPMARYRAIQETMEQIAKPYAEMDHTEADVYPFYENNAYFLVIYDVFTDVRLAFAPPTSLGKFGADTDNWMWPRHTNDFSVFRVYADANNKPADYSANNKPYKPRYVAKVSTSGVKEGDYSMTIGFPGSTDRYLSSWGVINRMENQNEPRILVRGIKQEIWQQHMQADQATRIQYASKYAGSSNYWKNSIGMNRGLRKLNVVGKKQEIERQFAEWVAQDPARQAKYGAVLSRLESSLKASGPLEHDAMILTEALNGIELRPLTAMPSSDIDAFDAEVLYKDFSPEVAKATLPAMLRVVKEHVAPEHLPDIYTEIDEKFAGNYERYAEYVYNNSVVVQKHRILEALKNYKTFSAAHDSDPAVILVRSFQKRIGEIWQKANGYTFDYYDARRLFFAGLQEMSPTYLPSDANFTMRLSYGSVGGYKPFDAAWYDYYTTEDGILEKQDPTSHEFTVQPEILKMLRDKDFGDYADEDGKLHICFISNNDITGGNSGSPVFNGDGNLIGLAFDGNWEAMSGDIEFEPNLQRCINVDIRAVLWAIHNWGKADNLIDELTLVP
ncbi:MAG: S46 family peptidase [Porphyromonas sp.]|nr:S46 family peptidase [Porphyromonas sp.]